MNDLIQSPLTALAVFAVSACVVWIVGARLAYLADAISDRLKLSKSLIGLLLLASATSLPEIATTFAAATRQNQELTLNNLYGGVVLQTSILALADFYARGSITFYPRRMNHVLEALLLVGLLSITLIFLILGDPLALGSVGFGSVVVALAYIGCIWLLRVHDPEHDWLPVDLPGESAEELPLMGTTPQDQTLKQLVTLTALSSGAILIFGIALVLSAERLAVTTGLGESFVGVSLLAAATSLPELTTSIAAVRMGAYTLAISNIFGSNLIMLVLVFPADILFRSGPILRDAGPVVPLALSFGILVTLIYVVGLVVRRKPRIGPFGIDSILVFAVFFLSLHTYYTMR